MQPKRTSWFKRLALAVIAFFASLVLGVFYFTSTTPGLKNLADIASGLASSPGNKIEIRGVKNLWFGTTKIDELALSDDRGVYATIKGIEADWSRSALLAFRFSAVAIKVVNIDLERVPNLHGSTDEPFSLHVEMETGAFEIARLSLGEGLVSGGADLTLSGRLSAFASPIDIASLFEVKRLDREGDSGKLEFAYRPAEGLLALDLEYFEPADGIFANLLGLPERPDLVVSVKTTGALSDLDFNAFATADKRQILNLDGKMIRQDKRTRLIAKGTSRPASLVPSNLKELLAGDISVDVDISRTDIGAITISKAKMDTDTFYGVATGSFDPAGQSNISGGFTTRNTAVNLMEGVVPGTKNFAPKSIAFQIEGPAEKSAVTASFDIPLIDMDDIKLTGLKVLLASDDFDFTQTTGTFTLNGEAASLLHSNPEISRFLGGEIYLSAKGSMDQKTLRWRSLELLNKAVRMQSQGNYIFSSQELVTDLQSSISTQMAPENARNFLGDDIDLSASLSMSRFENIDISGIALHSANTTLKGDARVSDNSISSDIRLSVAKLGRYHESVDGSIEGVLAVSGAIDAPRINLVLSSDKIKVDNHLISGLKLGVVGIASPENPDFKVQLDGTIDGLPLVGRAIVRISDGNRVIDAINIRNGKNRLSGSLILNDAAIPVGELRFDFENIGAMAALALQKIDGATSGIVNFSSNGGKAIADISLLNARLAKDELSVSDLTANVKIADYLNSPVISGNASAENIISGNTQLVATRLKMERDEGWTRFDVSTNLDRNLPLEATGRVQVKDGRTVVALDTALANIQSVAIALAAPTNLIISDGNTTISDAVLEIGGGSATINGAVSSDLDLQIALANVSASLANQFAPDLRAGGLVSGPVSIEGAPASPDVMFDLNWQDATTSQISGTGLGALNINANGSYSGKLLRINSDISGGGGVNFNGNGTVQLAEAPDLDLAFNGTLPFSVLASTLNENGVSLTGNARANIVVAGKADNPSINGDITSQDARFVHADSGISINEIILGVDFAEGQARIQKLTGRLSTGGIVDVSGSIGIQGQVGFPADIRIVAKDAVYTDGKTVNTNFDAALNLTGSLINEPLLAGRVDLRKTVITVPEKIPNSISKLNVQHRNASAQVEAQSDSFKPKENQSSSGILLDLQINAANQIFVRGRGIDAELAGALTLAGGLSSPIARGSFDLRRGRLSILGKRLNFTSGTITFAGSLVPELNLSADSQSDDVTITVSVTGPANNPVFGFSSVPALAEDEVLARLIFNRNIASLSALQIVQLWQAVATLTGAGGNSSLLDKFQKLIKVDDLDIRTDAETGETTVGVGSYVNDKTYIAVERGNSPGTGKATIDLNIGRGVKLRGEATETGKNKAGIFFEREY